MAAVIWGCYQASNGCIVQITSAVVGKNLVMALEFAFLGETLASFGTKLEA